MTYVCLCIGLWAGHARGQLTANEQHASVGDAPRDPGVLATDISPRLEQGSIQAAMRKVANLQYGRVVSTPSQDWTFTTLYLGMLAASRTLSEPKYHDMVLGVAQHYDWSLGPRQAHADDQAIGQVYLALYSEDRDPLRIAPLRLQFDALMKQPDDSAKPVWWWCDALFMAPPVWSGLADVTRDPKYLAYMYHEWHVTSNLLWDPHESLF